MKHQALSPEIILYWYLVSCTALELGSDMAELFPTYSSGEMLRLARHLHRILRRTRSISSPSSMVPGNRHVAPPGLSETLPVTSTVLLHKAIALLHFILFKYATVSRFIIHWSMVSCEFRTDPQSQKRLS